MRADIRIRPSIRNRWVEELRHYTIWIDETRYLRFQHARTLKFCKAFQLIAGKPAKKIDDTMSY